MNTENEPELTDLEIMMQEPLESFTDTRSSQIVGIFFPMARKVQGFEKSLSKILKEDINSKTIKSAKRLRLDIVAVRTAANRARVAEKEEHLLAGRAIDSVYNIFKFSVSKLEKKLEEIENHYEIQEAEEKAQRQSERFAILDDYDANIDGLDLGSMNKEAWENYLSGVKAQQAAQIKAEKDAEDARILIQAKADLFTARKEKLLPLSDYVKTHLLTDETTEEEFTTLLSDAKAKKEAHTKQVEATRIENARLRAEQVEKDRIAAEKLAEEKAKNEEALRIEHEKQVKIESDRIEKEAADKKIRDDKEAADKKIRANIEAARTKQEAADKKIRDDKEQKLKDDLAAAKKESDLAKQKEVAEEEARRASEKALLAAPDKEKLENLIIHIVAIRTTLTMQEAIDSATVCITDLTETVSFL